MEQIKVFKEERVSQKNGSKYQVLIIAYNGYSKIVFLNDAEKVIFRDIPVSSESF